MIAELRRWFGVHPHLKDRLRPFLRKLGYKWPAHAALAQHLNDTSQYRAVQVGAHDGVTHDPCREYFIRPNWQAVVVEPNPASFKLLRENYRRYPRVHPVNAAVSYYQRELKLWVFEDAFLAARNDARVLSTLVSASRENIQRFVAPQDDAMNHLQQIAVPCLTIEELAATRNWSKVDALFVDVEGNEEDVLIGPDYERLGVKLVLFENHLLPERGAKLKVHLAQFGFVCSDAGVDTLAVR